MTLPVPTAPSPDEGTVVGFNYAVLNEAQAQEAQAAAEKIRGHMQSTFESVVEAGRELIRMKDLLEHGAFGPWLRTELAMKESTAQNWMNTARHFGGKTQRLGDLPLATVYQLAAPSTPEPIRADVIRQLEEGQRVEPAVIADTIRTAKQQEREQKEAEARAAELAKLTDEQRADLEKKAKRQRRTREQREAETARERADWKAKREREEHAAHEAVRMVIERLGEDFERFARLVAEAGWCFDSAVKAQAQEPVTVAPPVSAEKPSEGRALAYVRMISSGPQTTSERLALLNSTALSTGKGVAL